MTTKADVWTSFAGAPSVWMLGPREGLILKAWSAINKTGAAGPYNICSPNSSTPVDE